MNDNTQTNVVRKKISLQEKVTSGRDGNKKNYNANKHELLKHKLTVDQLNDIEKLPHTMIKNKRSSTKHETVESSSDSRSKVSVDRPIIDQSINASVNIKYKQKLSSKTGISQKLDGISVKNKLKKQINDDEKKRGISTVYMPKKSSHTAKEISESKKKDSNKSTIKIKDSSKNYSKSSNSNSRSSSSNTNIDQHRVPSRDRKKSRTLSPSEIKMLKPNIETSIVSSDTASIAKSSANRESSPDYNYEDDFEDYESDFQECTDSDEAEASQISDDSELTNNEPEISPIELKTQNIEKKVITNLLTKKCIEEEHMLDSGHYELQEARRRAARVDLMSAHQSARAPTRIIEHSVFIDEKPSEIKSLPSSADEGFEDGRSGDFIKSSSTLTSIDSINSKQRDEININKNENHTKPTHRRLTRGQRLLQMIKLDVVQWSLYESTPIAYEEFIRIHGKINTRQISTQTNDDNLSVEVQTDEIEYKNMWTQFPITCRNVLKSNNDIDSFMAELAGVGDDQNHKKPPPQYDILELNEFITTAGNVILTLLENKQFQKTNTVSNNSDTHQLPFADAVIKLSIANVTFLSARPVTMIRYSDISSKILLTIHDHVDEQVETSNEDFYVIDCCIGSIWNIFDPLRPIKCFYSSSNITACCFHPTNYNIVFGGLEDGSVSLWDLAENESYHRRIIDNENKCEWTIRCATFNSGGNLEDIIQSKIVALTVLTKIETNTADDIGKFMPLQICSLNEDGGCIVWSVLKNFDGSSLNTQDLGQSWWGKLRLIKSHDIPINFKTEMKIENFLRDFRDINVDSINKNNLYIAANISQILHITRFGLKPTPSLFNGIDCVGGTTCIEVCPFGYPFFLVGCEDGTIRLYSSTLEKPLLQLKNSNSNASVKIIQWSKSKAFIIYVLDDDAIIHVWDLNGSNSCPAHSYTVDKYAHVTSMQLSPLRTGRDMVNQYMAVGLDNGTIEVHKFNQQFHHSHKDNLLIELETFFNYLDIHH